MTVYALLLITASTIYIDIYFFAMSLRFQSDAFMSKTVEILMFSGQFISLLISAY